MTTTTTHTTPTTTTKRATKKETAAAYWNRVLAPYKKPDTRRAVFQLLSTAVPFVALWGLMLWSLQVSYALTLLLAVPIAGLQVRLFIIQHDCGHGSFFPSKRANDVLGSILGVVTLTPYRYWRRTHAIHHATSGNLDRRDFGEVTTLTVDEYLAAGPWKRLGYRLYRNPLVLLVLRPAWQFLIKHRLPVDAPKTWRAEWLGVMGTNVALAGAVAV
ncbi:MAG: fatty acid desaturase, partial [Thermoanaerobaculia bacterium]